MLFYVDNKYPSGKRAKEKQNQKYSYLKLGTEIAGDLDLINSKDIFPDEVFLHVKLEPVLMQNNAKVIINAEDEKIEKLLYEKLEKCHCFGIKILFNNFGYYETKTNHKEKKRVYKINKESILKILNTEFVKSFCYETGVVNFICNNEAKWVCENQENTYNPYLGVFDNQDITKCRQIYYGIKDPKKLSGDPIILISPEAISPNDRQDKSKFRNVKTPESLSLVDTINGGSVKITILYDGAKAEYVSRGYSKSQEKDCDCTIRFKLA